MAKGVSFPSSDHPPPPFPIFINTNLDTHLAMVLSPDDTVANLKGKIRIEHALCFPNIGEVSIQALKVKRRASFYHLSDSMLVKSAFSGIKGTWFLHLDLEHTTSLVKVQTKASVMSETHGQLEKHNVHQEGHNGSLSPVRDGDRPQDFVANVMTIGKGSIETSIANNHESETLPDTLLHKPSAQGDPLLPDVSSAQTQSLHVSSNELDRRPDPDVPEMVVVTNRDAAVGSNHQQKSGQVADKGYKDRKGDNDGNVDVGDDVNDPVVATKKEKSRKRSSDLLMDKFVDAKSELPYAEKKKHKEKNRPFKEPVKDRIAGDDLESCVYSKEMSRLEKVVPLNSFQEKHETSIVITERLSKSTTSTEFLIACSKELDSADFCKEAEQLSNLVDSEIPANCCHVKKKSKIEKDASSKHDALDSSVKPVNKENIDEASGSIQDKPSQVSVVAMIDTELGNRNATKSEIPSQISVKSSQRRRKKKSEKTEMSNTQSTPLETVISSTTRDQVLEENQNKTSITCQEHPCKKFKGAAVPGDAAAAGNSAVVESTFPSVPNDKKQKRREKKSQKIELHHQESNVQSNTHKILNSSRDQVIEELSRETSVRHLEYLGNESKEANVVREAVENSISAQVIVPSNPNDKMSKRSWKKSENIELPSRVSSRAEAVQSLVDKVTEENLKVSLMEDNQTGTSGSHLEHPDKEPEEVAVFGEAAVVANPSRVPLCPSNKKSKRCRKKSGKTELPKKESSKDEVSHSLVKLAAKDDPGESLDGSCASVGDNSKSAIPLSEAAGPESTAKLEKKNDRSGLIDNSSRNYELDRSLVSDHTHEDLEKVLRPSSKSSGHEFNARISSEGTYQNMDHANPFNLNTTGLDDSCDKNATGYLSAKNATNENTIGLQEAREESDMGTVKSTIHKGSTEFIEAYDHRELPKSDSGKIDFKFFDPKENELEPVQELPYVETETRKTNKENTKRKKRLNPSPKDSTASFLKTSVSDKQHTLSKKHQDSDSGNHSLSDPSLHIAAELLPSKKRKKKDANRTHKSYVRHPDTSYDVGSPRRSNDDDMPGKKIQNYKSSTHFQVPLSVDEESKHFNGKNSMSARSKLQTLAHNEGNEIMVSATEIPKNKNFVASVRSSPGGAPVIQNSSNAVANDGVEEDMAYLAPSSDNTEEVTPIIRKRCRVAVRKVPSNRHLKVLNKFNEEKTSLASSATIFNDATGGSFEDIFVVRNKLTPIKAMPDNLSSAHSNGDIEEKQISYKTSPGAEAESTDYCMGDKGTDGARRNLTQSPNVKRNGKSFSMILRSASSDKKVKKTKVVHN